MARTPVQSALGFPGYFPLRHHCYLYRCINYDYVDARTMIFLNLGFSSNFMLRLKGLRRNDIKSLCKIDISVHFPTISIKYIPFFVPVSKLKNDIE